MRISDWSSDVCSSDLIAIVTHKEQMVGRYFDRSIPIQCLIAQIYDVVISPIGKGFALDRQIAIRGSIGLHTLAAGELIRRTGRVLVNSQMKIRPRFLLDRHSIQYDLPIAYFYCVAGQADNTLDRKSTRLNSSP